MWPFKKQETNTDIVTNQNPNMVVYDDDMRKGDGYLNAVHNAITRTLRRTLGGNGIYGVSPNGKRDFNQLFGYGEILSYDDYYQMYLRGGIAKAIIDKLPKACWRDIPILKVGDTQVLKVELEALKNFGFFKAFERADILNRIGSFSVLVIGIPDSEDLNQPLGTAQKGNFESMYFNAYSYDGIEINKWDTDPASSRFSLPELYSVQISTTRTGQNKDTNTKSYVVHWSRVIHMAEGNLESSIEGIPSLQAPWNALTDKDKIRGSSAEAYYRNARQKLSLEADKDTQIDTSVEGVNKLKENIEQFQNNQEDTLRLKGMTANMLQPGLASPRDSSDIAVEDVVGTTGIPARVLGVKTGGNTTGTEDKATWNALVKDRQESDCTVWLMVGLRMLDTAGMIDLPDNVKIEWPPMGALTALDESIVIKNKADALKSVLDALSTLGASDVDPKSVFAAIGLDSIEIDNEDLNDEDLDNQTITGGTNDS